MVNITIAHNSIWKWVEVDGSTLFTFYWQDFNPDVPSYPSSFLYTDATQQTSTFDLSGFQPWHEVGCWVVDLRIYWPHSAYSNTLHADFERYDGSWDYDWSYSTSFTIKSLPDDAWEDEYKGYWLYMYFWVDTDEVWEWYSKYRIHWYTTNWDLDFYSPEFTVSHLSIDDTLHKAGYLWVEWYNLCYTDNTGSAVWQSWYGYKHKIAYDSWYSSYVWTENSGYIRLDDNNILQIYYVDADGNRRRTYASSARYGGNVNVWSENKWYMRVWWDTVAQWYGHLCFVAPNGSKRRILNWPPAGYE